MLDHVSCDRGIVIYRCCVRHRAYARPSTCSRRSTSTRDRFLMLLPGLAKMYVHVDKARRNKQTARIEHLASFRRFLARPEPRLNTPVLDQDGHSRIFRRSRIDQMAVSDKEFHIGTWTSARISLFSIHCRTIFPSFGYFGSAFTSFNCSKCRSLWPVRKSNPCRLSIDPIGLCINVLRRSALFVLKCSIVAALVFSKLESSSSRVFHRPFGLTCSVAWNFCCRLVIASISAVSAIRGTSSHFTGVFALAALNIPISAFSTTIICSAISPIVQRPGAERKFSWVSDKPVNCFTKSSLVSFIYFNANSRSFSVNTTAVFGG